MNRETELRHVDQGPRPGETSEGFDLIVVDVDTTIDPAEFLERCRQVMRAVLTMAPEDFLTEPSHPVNLPGWFVRACGPAQSEEEHRRWDEWWLTLDCEDQIKASKGKRWSLSGWLQWLEPDDERTWFWWDARIIGERQARVIVEIPDWPPPLGALDWLLRAAGAEEVVIDELAQP